MSEVDDGCFTHRFSEQVAFIVDFLSAADIRRFSYIYVFVTQCDMKICYLAVDNVRFVIVVIKTVVL